MISDFFGQFGHITVFQTQGIAIADECEYFLELGVTDEVFPKLFNIHGWAGLGRVFIDDNQLLKQVCTFCIYCPQIGDYQFYVVYIVIFN